MRYAVAHGRRSGRGGAAALGAAAVRRLRAAGHGVVEVEASSLEEARAACESVVADGVDVLAVAGGDGVVSMATDLCAGTDTAVGILPAGTGNDNARSLGIPLDADGALGVLLSGHARRVDALHLPDLDRHVLGSVNAALDARIAHRATRLPRVLGAASYTVAALAEIALLPWRDAPTYRITADGSTEEVEALVVTVTNMAYLGGGLRLSPRSDPADGLLDLVVIGQVGPVEALGLLRDVRAGRASAHPAVTVTPVRSVRVEGPVDVLVHGDGEAIAPLPLSVRVAPSALRVVAPPLA